MKQRRIALRLSFSLVQRKEASLLLIDITDRAPHILIKIGRREYPSFQMGSQKLKIDSS
jgi:hypothetical protein